MALKHETDNNPIVGSGFLARINSGIFLVTVAHLGDPVLAPRAYWSLWPDKLLLADTKTAGKEGERPGAVMEFPLFFEGNRGKRVPRFKYALRPELPGIIQDVILLPLQSDDLIVKMYSSFDMPTDRGTHEAGATVTMLGRRNVFPALSATEHFLTWKGGPARYMIPEGQPGDSGGPVVSSTGLLLGMNVGTHTEIPGQAMLISAEAIESVATAVNGDAKDWPRSEPEAPAQPHQ